MKNGFDDSFSTDVLVAGAGYAGIKAAFECAKAGLDVVLAAEKALCSGGSFFPLCDGIGCLAPKDDEDKDLLLRELEKRAAGMHNRRLCEIYIDEIQDRIKELPEIGFEIVPLKGRNACFAETEHHLVCWHEFNKIKRNVREIFSKLPSVRIMEFCDVLHLIKKEGRISGAVIADSTSRLFYVRANNVILATGGFGGLYKHSGTSSDVCGQGQVMSLEAGAKLVNLEFIQLAPALLSPVYRAGLSEQTYLYCRGVYDESGAEVLSRCLPQGVTARECLDQRSTHGPFTSMDISKYFDIAIMKEILKTGRDGCCHLEYSPDIYKLDNPALKLFLSFLESIRINLLRDTLKLTIFGHAANGGVMFDENCATGVEGLYVAGEVAGGLHGADRLGGLASGCCFVFGKRAAKSVIRRKEKGLAEYASDAEALGQYAKMLDSGNVGTMESDEVLVEIKNLMWRYGNVVRDESSLDQGLSRLNDLSAYYNAMRAIESGGAVREAVKARHSIKMARMFLTAARERRESRGAHYREDYPACNGVDYEKRLVLSESEGNLKIEMCI